MVQLQLLDLMIPKECGAVDAATRADLIDLMARVLGPVYIHRVHSTLATKLTIAAKHLSVFS